MMEKQADKISPMKERKKHLDNLVKEAEGKIRQLINAFGSHDDPNVLDMFR